MAKLAQPEAAQEAAKYAAAYQASLTKFVQLQLMHLQLLKRMLMLLWQTFKVNTLLLSQLQKLAKLLTNSFVMPYKKNRLRAVFYCLKQTYQASLNIAWQPCSLIGNTINCF